MRRLVSSGGAAALQGWRPHPPQSLISRGSLCATGLSNVCLRCIKARCWRRWMWRCCTQCPRRRNCARHQTSTPKAYLFTKVLVLRPNRKAPAAIDVAAQQHATAQLPRYTKGSSMYSVSDIESAASLFIQTCFPCRQAKCLQRQLHELCVRHQSCGKSCWRDHNAPCRKARRLLPSTWRRRRTRQRRRLVTRRAASSRRWKSAASGGRPRMPPPCSCCR